MGKVLSEFTNGYPGAISRAVDDIVATFVNKESSADIPFGGPVMMKTDGKGVQNFTCTIAPAAETQAAILGIAVRNGDKTPATYGSNEAAYAPGEMTDVITRGCVVVKVNSGTPKPGGKVYWTTSGFTPTYTQYSVAEITNMRWKSEKDANNNAEAVLIERQI